MPYHPPRFKQKARELFLSGEFSSIKGLAKHLGISRKTLQHWYKVGCWGSLRQRMDQEVAERQAATLTEQMCEQSKIHFRVWKAFIASVARMLMDKEGKPLHPSSRVMQELSVVMERAQDGQVKAAATEAGKGDTGTLRVLFEGVAEESEKIERQWDLERENEELRKELAKLREPSNGHPADATQGNGASNAT